jgi:hypothetical protein
LELTINASYAGRHSKLVELKKASAKLDLLKFFMKMLWELKILDNGKYRLISEPLSEIGRMLGGWQRQLQKETPPAGGEQ